MKRQESKVTCKGLFYQTQSDEPVTELEEALRFYLLCPTLIFTYTHTCMHTHVHFHTCIHSHICIQAKVISAWLLSVLRLPKVSFFHPDWAVGPAKGTKWGWGQSFSCSCGSRDAWKTCEWGILPQTEVSAWTLCTLRLRSIHIRDSHWPLSL